MQCRACGADNTSDRRFCDGCGAPLAVTCLIGRTAHSRATLSARRLVTRE